MKNKRTLRTLKRASLDEAGIGFAGYTPTGKYVKSLAKMLRAIDKHNRSPLYTHVYRLNTSIKTRLKILTNYAKSPKVVQEAFAKTF